MDLLENEQQIEKNKKMKVIMIVIIVCIILLLCLSAGIVYLIYDVQKNTTKLTIDEKQITNFSSDLFLFEDDTIYVSIRDFAELVGYKGYNGDYTSEGLTKGYIQNDYEEASYTLNSNKLYKRLLDSNDNEYYDLEKPVKIQNNKLYMSIEGVQIAATCAIDYNETNKQFTVYTLSYLTKRYTEKFKDAAIIEENASYSNQKALLYNLVVVKGTNSDNEANGKYGVKSGDGQEIIGTKYTSIKFLESTGEFIVTTENGKMGILSSKGATKIQPAYDEIKQIDKDLNLYLVKSNNKYGVVNQNGNIVIYLEYDQIGIDTTQYESNDIKNQYLLFDNCIPVQRDKKWGFFDKTGKQIVELKYTDIGCVVGTNDGTSSQNLLIIPDYEAIVVAAEKDNTKKYGLINSLGEELIPCVLDSLYSIRTSGQDTYYMVQNTNTVEILGWLQKNGKQKPNKATEENTNTVEDNTVENETANTAATTDTTNATTTGTATNTMTNAGTNTRSYIKTNYNKSNKSDQ